MRVLGIDPGSQKTGYAILDEGPRSPAVVACGVISAPRGPLAARLCAIQCALEELIQAHRPEAAAVEEVFHAHNVKAALVLGHARGVALAVASRAGLEVFEYPARRIKQTITGHGGADKEQVRRVLVAELGDLPEQLDATDAVAIALCHLRFHGGAN